MCSPSPVDVLVTLVARSTVDPSLVWTRIEDVSSTRKQATSINETWSYMCESMSITRLNRWCHQGMTMKWALQLMWSRHLIRYSANIVFTSYGRWLIDLIWKVHLLYLSRRDTIEKETKIPTTNLHHDNLSLRYRLNGNDTYTWSCKYLDEFFSSSVTLRCVTIAIFTKGRINYSFRTRRGKKPASIVSLQSMGETTSNPSILSHVIAVHMWIFNYSENTGYSLNSQAWEEFSWPWRRLNRAYVLGLCDWRLSSIRTN